MNIGFILVASLGALLLLGWPDRAHAETLEEKVCVFASAERLPAIAGLVVKAGTAAAIPAVQGAREVVGWFPDPVRASEDLGRRFGPLPPDLDLSVRRLVARGEFDAAGARLADGLAPLLVGAAHVEIGVSALGREAVYGFTCIWKSTRQLATAPTGMLR